MIEWALIARIAGGGFASTILTLAILAVVIWLIGFVIRRRTTRGRG
ncbi:MAG: hydrophobic protein [Dehalococcoidia bacterium]